ncbi:MAG TPA: phytanoyl-CoA dioxygenase family protein [Caulobacteraceae bacterium]|nr:phytanoyl-CoA dioxygenase family protein [Caulobacteraceae bacterium]
MAEIASPTSNRLADRLPDIRPGQVERFERDGFLAIERLVEPEALAELAEVYDAILDRRIDCGPTDELLGCITRQIMFPNWYHPIFTENAAYLNGKAVAARLLGVDEPVPVFQMLIYKEPGQLATTPWHQDFSYTKMPFARAGSRIPYDEVLQFWVPLDDADEENGCMHFVPGEHDKPMREHYVFAGEPDYSQRLLAIRDPETALDLSKAVACPLKVGGATVHNYGAPHFTPGNRTTDRPRRAYIFNWAKPSQIGFQEVARRRQEQIFGRNARPS